MSIGIKREVVISFVSGMLFMGLIIGIGFWIKKPSQQEHFTHEEIKKSVIKNGIAEIFYPVGNIQQERLAKRVAKIIDKEYGVICQVLELKQEEILSSQTYGFVFCESFDDTVLSRLKDGLISIDGVLCWPIVSENSFPFKDPVLRFRLYCTLPAQAVKGIIEKRLKIDKNSASWFIEGISGYIGFTCWQALDKSSFFDYEYTKGINLYKEYQEKGGTQTLNLLNYSSFDEQGDFAAYIFSYASTFLMIDLVTKYSSRIIPETLNRLSKEKGKIKGITIVKAIESLTGENIIQQLENIPVKDTQQRFEMLKKRLLPIPKTGEK